MKAQTTNEGVATTDAIGGGAHAEMLDAVAYAVRARFTGGLSPAAAALAWYDWALHLALSPGKQALLGKTALADLQRFARYVVRTTTDRACPQCIEPLEQDRRFADPSWQHWPFNWIHQGFLLQQQWWQDATTGVHGVTRHHERMVDFASRQWLDIWSPANFVATNPEVLGSLLSSGGATLGQGAINFIEDLGRLLLDESPVGTEDFVVGRDVAVTPGKVVFRNHLIELIQYAPTTPQVHAEPVLIVPSWIMKYYILDLSPHNSMVRFLVEQGHTVFIISWRNPDSADRELGLDDYRRLGVMEALDAVSAIAAGHKIQAVGYCLGGTLLAIAAAAMARDGDDRLHGLTLLAAEADFRDSGEISLFIDESQLAWLEAGMWAKGYLDGKQMAGAFQMLNSRDLLWSRRVREYLLGERQPLNDLMAWNADLTRMPYRMHSEYLRRLYLDNDLAEGRFRVGEKPIALADIRVPMFVVGTERDHVAPWRSVYKLHLLTDAELTFALTSGGHNAGVVSEPGHPRRSFRIATRHAGERYVDPERWRAEAQRQQGSWWTAWQHWLAERSSARVAARSLGSPLGRRYAPLDDAPGTYVRMR